MSTLRLPGINAGARSGLTLSGASLPFGAAERVNPLALILNINLSPWFALIETSLLKKTDFGAKVKGNPNSDLEIVMRGNRSNLAFYNEIDTHLAGARSDRVGKGFRFLNRDSGENIPLTFLIQYV